MKFPGMRGERGRTGDHGQPGSEGEQGERGERGKSLSVWQALAMFLVVLATAVTLSVRTELQQRDLERQQQQIATNTERIQAARHQSCLNGVIIIKRLNRQMEALAQIERDLTVKASPAGKRIGEARIRAYEEGLTRPIPECE